MYSVVNMDALSGSGIWPRCVCCSDVETIQFIVQYASIECTKSAVEKNSWQTSRGWTF